MFRYLKEIQLVIIIIFIAGLYGIYFYEKYYNIDTDEIIENNLISNNVGEEEKSNIDTFYIEIKGLVVNPGVYEVNSNNIVNDAILMAGGFKSNAYTDNINLSKHVSSEMVIKVYSKYEFSKFEVSKQPSVICDCPSYDISKCEKEIVVEEEKTTNQLININTATIEQLTTLSGIGDAKAKSIVDYRNTNGLFSVIDDITKVSGISQTIYEKIKDYITV